MARMFGRYVDDRPRGSLMIAGPGYEDRQDETGTRAVTRDVGGFGLTEARPTAGGTRMRSSVMDAEQAAPGQNFGDRTLRPGEREVVVPSSVDRNGNGIPDGAEVKFTATWRQGQRASVMATEPGSLTGQAETRQAEQGLAEQARAQRGQLQEMREASPFSRNTVGGVSLPEMARARDERAVERTAGTERALGVAERTFERPAQEATERMRLAQAGANERAAGAATVATGRTTEQGRQFDARLAETARQFNAKSEQKIEFVTDPVSGERMWSLNGQAGRVRGTTDGFVQLVDQAGKVRGTLTAEGDLVKFDPDTGEPVIDRAPRVPRSVSGGGGMGLFDVPGMDGGGEAAGAGGAVGNPVAGTPPVTGARQAADGMWYVQRNGEWFRVN